METKVEEKEKSWWQIFIYMSILSISIILVFLHGAGLFSSTYALQELSSQAPLILSVFIFMSVYMTLICFRIKWALIFSFIYSLIFYLIAWFIPSNQETFILIALPFIFIGFILITGLITFILQKLFYKFKTQNISLKNAMMLSIPFVLLVVILFMNVSTCSFNFNPYCLSNKAIEQNDPNICLTIFDSSEEDCYWMIIEHFEDITLCEHSTNKDVCLSKIVISQISERKFYPYMCDSFSKENLRKDCYVNYFHQIADWKDKKYTGNSKDLEYLKESRSKFSPTLCENYLGNTKFICYSAYISILDYDKENESLCLEIKDEHFQGECYKKFI